uniref:Uncharacterized protein n=1 Tax=Fagus sylvatica TaxID=28930 RepID=A0A2N9GQZ5_FAGSY
MKAVKAGVGIRTNNASSNETASQQQLSSAPSNSNPNKNLEYRSFWKGRGLRRELEHARVHPKFLHSNATSHKWAFGAIAELLDNAVDEV